MWKLFASRKVKAAMEDSKCHLERVTEKANSLDPQIQRLRKNIENNHVVANVMASFRGAER